MLTIMATARGVSIAEPDQSGFEIPIYVSMSSTSALRPKLWPLIRRRIVIEEVVVPGVTVRIEINGQNWVSLEALFCLVKDDANKSFPCNVIVYQFTENQARVSLTKLAPQLPSLLSLVGDNSLHPGIIV